MLDGVAENYTAAMLEPYEDGCGCSTENSGLDFVDPLGLKEYVTRLDAEGFQVHFHALGDRAVRHALDAVEVARAANGPDGGRHHLAHLQVVHPEDVPRFAQVGATANIQALWAAHEMQMDELTIPFLGERRAAWQYPMDGIHVAVNRRVPGSDATKEPLYAEQALALHIAMSAYTAGSARVNGHDDVTGRLEPGMYADLAILDRDPFAGASEDIADATVVQTFVEGDAPIDNLRRMSWTLRRSYLRRPGLAREVASRFTGGRAEAEAVRHMRNDMHELGYDDDAAIARVRALAEMTLGHIIMTCEMLMLPGQAQAFEYEMGRSYFTYPIEPLHEWDPAEARARHLADGEAVFGSMLETFLDGIKAGAPKP